MNVVIHPFSKRLVACMVNMQWEFFKIKVISLFLDNLCTHTALRYLTWQTFPIVSHKIYIMNKILFYTLFL